MKKILYFDCFAGISGDMALAALVDTGLDGGKVIEELKKLNVDGWSISFNKTQKSSITGTDADVQIKDIHQHTPSHEGHEHTKTYNRNLEDINNIISASDIDEHAKKMALKIFTEIAAAEGRVHGKPLNDVHFHEVGAVDSIIDIVGTAICLCMLEIDEIYCSEVHEGHGFVDCQHGKLPIPVPAVLEMAKGSGIPLAIGDAPCELVTPTGFGILKALAKESGAMPKMMIKKIGYGFGKRDTGSLNALRVVIGEMNSEADSEKR